MNGDDLWFQVRRMINEYEQARDPDASEIGRQFAQLQRTMIENKDIYPSLEGAKAINRLKNRYKDVLPYDQHRVILQSDRNSDYINASFVEDFYGKRRYIAAQGPIEDSVEDFFQMIWENQITSIICAANDTEAGRFKFLRYWPDAEYSLDFNSYRITLDKTDDRAYQCEYYVIRPLIVSQGNNQRHVLLYHLLQWFDHDVPSSEEPIYELLIRLDKDRTASPDTPILIHCSAGCGRTGSIIAIDLGRLFLQDKHLQSLDHFRLQPVFAIATHIRQYRIALIQTTKQYLFVHKMFLYVLQITGHAPRSSSNNYPIEENASSPPPTSTIYSSSPSKSSRRSSGPFLNLRNPPIGRRSNRNGTSKTSPAVLQTSDSVVMPAKAEDSLDTYDPIPPPIPPRTLMNSLAVDAQINRRIVPRLSRAQHRHGQILENTTISNSIKPNRSDSADALSSPSSSSSSSKFNERAINHRAGIIFDHGAISD